MAPGIIENTQIAFGKTPPVVSKHTFLENADSEDYASNLDNTDPMRKFREKFIIPSKSALKSKSLSKTGKLCFASS